MGNKLYLLFILILCCNYLSPLKISGKNKYTVKIVQPDLVQAPVIGSVTVSPENKNVIAWKQTTNENIHYFKIYRDAANPEDGWIAVGNAMYPGNNLFTDLSSFPNVRSYQYRISAIDRCGNEIFSPRNHKTIKLNVEEFSNSSFTLKWNPYEGFEVDGYKIYRGADATNLIPVDTITHTITSYTDSENPYNKIYYQVEAIEKEEDSNEKKTSTVKTKIRSNIASNQSILTSTDATDNVQIHIYPNPLTLNAVVIFPYDSAHTYQLSILDLTGKTVYTKLVFSGEIEIERKNLKEGLYILQVAGRKIYRKKLMVGRA